MVWTDATRRRYERKFGRYASDCTNEEWSLIATYLPQTKRIGRPRTTNLRDVWDAIQYMACTGCQSLPVRQAKRRREGENDPQ